MFDCTNRNRDPRFTAVEVKTVGDLKNLLATIDDETPIVRLTDGYYRIYKQDVSIWLGRVSIGHQIEPLVEVLEINA